METLVFWKDHTNFYCTTIPQMPPGEKAAGERKGLTCLFRFQYRQGGALVKANMCKGCARVSWGIREGTCLRLWIGCCRELCKVYHSRRRRQAEGKAWPGVTFVKAIMCKFQSEMCEGLRKGLGFEVQGTSRLSCLEDCSDSGSQVSLAIRSMCMAVTFCATAELGWQYPSYLQNVIINNGKPTDPYFTNR